MDEKLYVVSLGCPKNLVDSELMLGLLEEGGYSVCEDPEEADLLLVNTCGFIQSAVEEGIDAILELAQLKQERPDTLLAVCGCMVQRYGEELKKEFPEVDLFVGTEGFQDIVSLLRDFKAGKNLPLYLAKPTFLMHSGMPRRISTPSHRAYLKVTEGCSNRCSYCLIPSLRGDLRSRPLDDLIAEARLLEKGGVKELTLVAQDLTAYGYDHGAGTPRLTDLLSGLLEGCGIPWIRMLYLYPARIDDTLLSLVKENERILPYFDIPLQHVSSHILQAMNRPGGGGSSVDLIDRIRAKLPEAAIRTTFIVGFPGERDEDVAELEDFIRTCRLDHVGVFSYSNEEGCAAAGLTGHCSEEVKEERRKLLMEEQARVSLSKNAAKVGTVCEVLVEGMSSETDLLLEGRTRFQAPEIDGGVYIASGICNPGDFVRVRITEAHPYDLVGEIIEGS